MRPTRWRCPTWPSSGSSSGAGSSPAATPGHQSPRLVLVGTAAIYAGGLDCPLTDWEKGLRRLAGDDVYPGGYLEHYLVSPWHPAGMTKGIGLGILGIAVATTAVAYGGRVKARASRPAN